MLSRERSGSAFAPTRWEVGAVEAHQERLGRTPRLVAADAAFYSAKKRNRGESKGVNASAFPIAPPRAGRYQISDHARNLGRASPVENTASSPWSTLLKSSGAVHTVSISVESKACGIKTPSAGHPADRTISGPSGRAPRGSFQGGRDEGHWRVSAPSGLRVFFGPSPAGPP
jgi:hypothetical protein